MTEGNATNVTGSGSPAGTGTPDPTAAGGQSGHAATPPVQAVNQGGGADGDLDLEDEKPSSLPPLPVERVSLDFDKLAQEPEEKSPPAVEKVSYDYAKLGQEPEKESPAPVEKVSQLDTAREGVRGDLARGLLWLLTLLIGGLLVFVGIGRVVPEVLTQSVFPSLVTLTGTALGFYFGSQSNKDSSTK